MIRVNKYGNNLLIISSWRNNSIYNKINSIGSGFFLLNQSPDCSMRLKNYQIKKP